MVKKKFFKFLKNNLKNNLKKFVKNKLKKS